MTDVWRRHAVNDLIQAKALEIGDGYRATNAELSRTGLPFARAGNIGDGFWFSGVDCLPEDKARQIGKKISRPGDVVFTSKGTVGRFAFVKDDTPRFVYSPQLCYWRSLDADILDARFLYYWMASHEFRSQVDIVAGQTDMAEYVNLRDQRRMHITAPPVPEQRAIGHVLGALDDKIDLNRRMNETLEAMARALFKSWFVDFDPVRARMEGIDTGLPAHVAELFPDRLTGSAPGMSPAGWEVVELGDCVEVVRGLSYKGSGLSADGLPMHNLNSIHEGGGYKEAGIKFYRGDYKARHVIRPGELIVANTEQGHERRLIGHSAVIPSYFGQAGLFSHHLYKLEPKGGRRLSPDYLCELLNAPGMQRMVSGYATGTTVNMLPSDALKRPPVSVPPAPLMDLFGKLAADLRTRREALVRECRVLAAARDELLPRLVSGRLRATG